MKIAEQIKGVHFVFSIRILDKKNIFLTIMIKEWEINYILTEEELSTLNLSQLQSVAKQNGIHAKHLTTEQDVIDLIKELGKVTTKVLSLSIRSFSPNNLGVFFFFCESSISQNVGQNFCTDFFTRFFFFPFVLQFFFFQYTFTLQKLCFTTLRNSKQL